MTTRVGPAAVLMALLIALAALACGPRAQPTMPAAGPIGPAAEARSVEVVWKDEGTVRRWALVGGLLHLGPSDGVPIRFRGEKKISGSSDGPLIRMGGKVVGVELTGLTPDKAAALLRRHGGTVETVIWRRARRLEPVVMRALAALAATKVVLSLWPDAEAPPMDLTPLGALGSKLYGLVLGAEVGPGGLRPLRRLRGLRVLEVRVSVRARDLRDVGALTSLRGLRLQNALAGHRLRGRALRSLGALRNLQQLDLSVNDLTDADLASLTSLRGLCWLDLGYNRIDGSGLVRLTPLNRLAVVDLSGNTLDDDALAAVGSRQGLRVLRLRKTAIGDDALAQLVGLSGLQALDVSHTHVGDEGLARLSVLKGLRSLSLDRTQVTSRGVAAFRTKRPGCWIDGSVAPAAAPRVVINASSLEGLPACRKYLQLMRCYIGKLPAAARPATQAAFRKTYEIWRKMMAQGGSQRASVARTCRMTLKAIKRAASSSPMFRGCVTP